MRGGWLPFFCSQFCWGLNGNPDDAATLANIWWDCCWCCHCCSFLDDTTLLLVLIRLWLLWSPPGLMFTPVENWWCTCRLKKKKKKFTAFGTYETDEVTWIWKFFETYLMVVWNIEHLEHLRFVRFTQVSISLHLLGSFRWAGGMEVSLAKKLHSFSFTVSISSAVVIHVEWSHLGLEIKLHFETCIFRFFCRWPSVDIFF